MVNMIERGANLGFITGANVSSIPTWALSAMIIMSLFYWLHQSLLLKPIPGIPYETESIKSILGDLPGMVKFSETGSMLEWLHHLCYKHASPLIQIFIAPLGKPFLVLGDFREARDILRRTSEWDRADWAIDGLGGVGRQHHLVQKTGPKWKLNRRLIKGIMSPTFLRSVAAPNIHKAMTSFVELLALKANFADGLPFDPSQDLSLAILEGIMGLTFGPTALPSENLQTLKFLESSDLQTQVQDAGLKGPMEFPLPAQPLPDFIESISQASESIADAFSWPRPSWYWIWHWVWPGNWVSWWLRTSYMRDQVRMSCDRLKPTSEGALAEAQSIDSAIDSILHRERTDAFNEGRLPEYFSGVINDELYGFIVAGHDTSKTTSQWGLKFISDNPVSQDILRKALRETHSDALAEGRLPTFEEITAASIPYLDATIEEILRLAGSFSILLRQATCDTVLLGHFIPKDTQMIVLLNGPDTTYPGVGAINESVRSLSSQRAALQRGVKAWDPKTVREFRPERWLATLGDGTISFDSQAGPSLPFSDGMRGCYGRKLAYLQLKIVFTLLAWSFEFLPCAQALSSYDGLERLTRGPKQCYVRLRTIC